MRTARTVAVVVFLALAPAAGAGLGTSLVHPFEDASDDRSEPTELQETGTYEGDLFPPGDEDWYRLVPEAVSSPGRPTCVEVAFAGHANARANLTTPHGEDHYVEANLTPDKPVSMGLATQGFDGSTFGLHPFEPLRSLGPYEFTVRTEQIGGPSAEDGGLDGSDSDTTPGPCIEERLEEDGELTIDFHASEGDRLTLSLASPTGEPVSIALEDPEGEPRGEIGPPSTDSAVLHETIDESGTWTLSASNEMATSSTSFLVGLSLADDCQMFCSFVFADDECDEDDEDECDDEDARPCQPNCMRS